MNEARIAVEHRPGLREPLQHGARRQARERRDLVVSMLNQAKGIKCPKPEGAFYMFPNITDTGLTSREYADYLLREADVAVLPGTSFGEFGEGYVRMSFANSEDNLKKALERIGKVNQKLPAVAAESRA